MDKALEDKRVYAEMAIENIVGTMEVYADKYKTLGELAFKALNLEELGTEYLLAELNALLEVVKNDVDVGVPYQTLEAAVRAHEAAWAHSKNHPSWDDDRREFERAFQWLRFHPYAQERFQLFAALLKGGDYLAEGLLS